MDLLSYLIANIGGNNMENKVLKLEKISVVDGVVTFRVVTFRVVTFRVAEQTHHD